MEASQDTPAVPTPPEEACPRCVELQTDNRLLRQALEETEETLRKLAVGTDADITVASAEGSSQDRRTTLHVLVVEDDAAQRAMIRHLFERCNELGSVFFVLRMADSLESAREMLVEHRDFNLILIDVLLPEGNGYDLLPYIRQMLGDKVAVVMNSAHDQMPLIKRCILEGADSFMLKPLLMDDVKNLWQYVLRKDRALFGLREGAAPVGAVSVADESGLAAVPRPPLCEPVQASDEVFAEHRALLAGLDGEALPPLQEMPPRGPALAPLDDEAALRVAVTRRPHSRRPPPAKPAAQRARRSERASRSLPGRVREWCETSQGCSTTPRCGRIR